MHICVRKKAGYSEVLQVPVHFHHISSRLSHPAGISESQIGDNSLSVMISQYLLLLLLPLNFDCVLGEQWMFYVYMLPRKGKNRRDFWVGMRGTHPYLIGIGTGLQRR